MLTYTELVLAGLIALVTTLVLTYPVKWLSIKLGAVDFPSHRKIHTKVTPRLGGIAIFFGALAGAIYLQPSHPHLPEIFLGAIVILITGILDDRYNIRPVVKLTGQLLAASFLISSGLIIEKLTLPFIGTVELGFISVFVTVLWIVGVTNAINLIDGLDGLATGVTTIALISIFAMAIIDSQILVAYLCISIIGANVGFLFHNFYPAKIYMGDTGSNFLGYMIACVSMLGLFKNIALFSFIIPVIVLAVPIFDTLFAIVRRAYNKENIMMADNKHIHYQLLRAGYSHRTTVLIIYGFSALFGLMAILLSNASIVINLVVTLFLLALFQLFAEMIGIVIGGKQPLLEALRKLVNKGSRNR
ncbi:undecaprenyl-phosphate alpha-N-acetylglucosaminyl 1-phosphate transferase [Virgibacillus halodenitrificans]|jgi:UDP-GlcNAc:undecaprenyl-phosphate/decaprenyl-phosphate GlcNAc-1-phosphate transferase|uniref:Undecaprenyl-phosphate alpha-N-acetylglucosaminyl 1-phosphate transferase n=1 Tax=Virgibacillus halodenitrificans TaxID=1482 RepID=A0AAC9J1V1_VIRHA|nr:MraY family glycosyltransferase [Virgibacillus halodenitrificans]APC49693.1 undecaprenyl-phosphate alpha-N-acetylglucosaminyl 1-phosphate transferase [Virgibacillus halodenitrificans]MYL47764.1 undecaprenyl-phosphate alpha-N-acetylglucosaminyl 1-phosphate transferase [Virgibacillus halodenitrificans]